MGSPSSPPTTSNFEISGAGYESEPMPTVGCSPMAIAHESPRPAFSSRCWNSYMRRREWRLTPRRFGPFTWKRWKPAVATPVAGSRAIRSPAVR